MFVANNVDSFNGAPGEIAAVFVATGAAISKEMSGKAPAVCDTKHLFLDKT